MKRNLPFLLLLAVLAGVTGYLLSRINFIGRVGISLAFHEYKFLKVWWQAGGLVLAVWLLLFAVHTGLQRSLGRSGARTAHLVGLLAAVAGLYFTYRDFREDLSHRILGSPFHSGAYLFWIGWMLIALFMLLSPARPGRSEMQVERPQ